MKSLATSIQESLLEESTIKPDERVLIDKLSNSDWKKFAQLVVKQLNDEFDEYTVLMAMKGLAGDGRQLAPSDFHKVSTGDDSYISVPSADDPKVQLQYDTNTQSWA